ncbi:hypothetical protein BN000_03078 [Neobacillus massiliamazoniensis]|uniref:Uncharacterized protein n=1 Tax=Neobacillus massiliamazoniensis TaxID=1499688 RepID=A0A0U1NYL0_9BACI|nr:hypothetical protein BN000_03078 [Neobacillus massiliamazoniensis]
MFGLGSAMVREFKRWRLTALKGLLEVNLTFKDHNLIVVEQILIQSANRSLMIFHNRAIFKITKKPNFSILLRNWAFYF